MMARSPPAGVLAFSIAILGAVAAVIVARPDSPSAWIGAAILIVGLLAAIGSMVITARSSQEVLKDRPELSAEEIYRDFFSDSGVPSAVVAELWDEAASIMGVSPGKMRPSDRFGHELGKYWITSEKLDALAQRARLRLGIDSSLDLTSIETLGSYIVELGTRIK